MKKKIALGIAIFFTVFISAVQANDRFIFSDLTVKDKKTGLIWAREVNPANQMHWNEALDFIKQLNKEKYAGFSNWRLPRKEELEEMVSYGINIGYKMWLNDNKLTDEEANNRGLRPSLEKVFNVVGFSFKIFSNGGCVYWSATPHSNPQVAWGVNLGQVQSGGSAIDYESVRRKSSEYDCVWPVRSGE